MPRSKSSLKQVRVVEKRRLRNKSTRSLCKTNITKSDKLLLSGDLDAARTATETAISTLDKAAEKGVIHRNNAARRKSRLLKRLNKIAAASSKDTGSVTEENT